MAENAKAGKDGIDERSRGITERGRKPCRLGNTKEEKPFLITLKKRVRNGEEGIFFWGYRSGGE